MKGGKARKERKKERKTELDIRYDVLKVLVFCIVEISITVIYFRRFEGIYRIYP